MILPVQNDIRLHYSQNNVTIVFNTINFTDPEENRFAWRSQNDPDNRDTMVLPERFKGEVVMTHDEKNEHACTGCTACELACPNATIKIITKFDVSPEGKKKKAIDKFVYVTVDHTVRVDRFDVATGALVASTTFAPAGGGPQAGSFGGSGMPVAFDPSGKFAYVSSSGSILVCAIDPATGALTQVGTSAARSQYALAIATASVIDPNPMP